ncbi:MAG: response regulator [Deltaproteobacteria bacterium]|nr:response regulator [Deltaproteobacteria bacterium]
MRILIVDDDRNGLLILEAMFKGFGHEVMAAENGQIALELARITPPELIISDILMPVMDGYKLCRKWKRDSKLQNIPFIFYTATHTDSRDEELALSLGAERFIVKPIEPDEFSKILQEIIRGVEEGKVKTAEPAQEEEKEVSKLYNERLIKKLEKKMLDLEREIAARRRADEALYVSALSWKTTFDAITDSVSIIDVEGKILQCNKATANFLGKPINEIVGKTCWELVHDTSEPIKGCPVVRMRETLRPESLELAVDDRVLYVATYPILDQDGNLSKAVHIITDITEQKKAKEALLESEERFRTVADFAYDCEYWIAPDGRVLYISPSCERITGYSPEDFVNDPGLIVKIVHPDDNSIVVDHLGEEQSLKKLPSIDFRIITRGGEERWISHVCQAVYGTDGTYLGRRASNRDISKRKKMEEELLKAKKLESLGVLAGGIAHDFNNMLTAVSGNISLARMMAESYDTEETVRLLTEAEKAAMRTKDLTARLITFSKGGEPVKEEVSIRVLLKESISTALRGSNIYREFSTSDDLWPVEIDGSQMKQVIHNIVTNSMEAMPGQGMIKVYCRNIDISEKDGLTLKHGKYVKISLEDQGSGIAEENLSKVFDPYFSTKEMGSQKGMGLGLAVAHSIVKKHGGLITIESQLGTGTNIHIYIPAITANRPSEIDSALHGAGKEPSTEHVLKQSSINNHQSTIQRVLVMDDEEMLRDVSSAMLSKLGYEVKVAIDGVEAIEMYNKAKESGEPYDAVILDLTNNVGMGGVEAIKKLLEIDPEIKAIVATGYSFDPVVDNYRDYGFCGAMTKPFGMDELNTALREVITGK